jgi:hypothetical protein
MRRALLRWAAVGLMVLTLVLGTAGLAGAAVISHITASYTASTERFHGKVTSSNAECVAHRTVRLFKETASGPKLVGKTTSGSKGGWHIEIMHAKGKYLARTPTQKEMNVSCGGAKSGVVDVM